MAMVYYYTPKAESSNQGPFGPGVSGSGGSSMFSVVGVSGFTLLFFCWGGGGSQSLGFPKP